MFRYSRLIFYIDGQYWKGDRTCISTTSDNQHKWLTSIWQSLVLPSSLTSQMIWIRNLYRFMNRQHVYDLEKRRGDCLMKWLIMLGFMDLRGPRVCRRSTPVLLNFSVHEILILQNYLLCSLNHFHIWQVSPQLGCGDTCQIWTWYSISNPCFDNREKIGK